VAFSEETAVDAGRRKDARNFGREILAAGIQVQSVGPGDGG